MADDDPATSGVELPIDSSSGTPSGNGSNVDGPSIPTRDECDAAQPLPRLRNATDELAQAMPQHDRDDQESQRESTIPAHANGDVDCASHVNSVSLGVDDADALGGGPESRDAVDPTRLADPKPTTGELSGSGPREGNVEANGEEVHHADALPAEPPELLALMDEVASIRSALAGSTSVDESDLLFQIRTWTHRIDARSDSASRDGSTQRTSTRLISMAVPTGEILTQESEDESQLLRVVGFDDGIYRGQVKRIAIDATMADEAVSNTGIEGTASERFVPHGWGIAASHTGLRRVGQWRDGEQVGVGSLQSAVFLYDGEWHATTGPCGYGIGTFAFGATFVGCWHNGKPYGLGRLQTFETNQYDHGWFYGTRCLLPVVIADRDTLHEECLRTHLPSRRFDHQPQRGLFLVGSILEDARLSSLRLAMEQWRRVACDQALVYARRRRADAMAAWVEAHAMEREAIAHHLDREMRAYKVHMAKLLEEVAAGRQKHARVERMREFHTNKLNAAIFQRDLARRCVVAQEETIALLDGELTEVSTLLEEATSAQAECERLAMQQQIVKRQIENATVKINALRQAIRSDERTGDQQQHQREQQFSRKDLQTPATPSYAKAIHGPRHGNMPQPIGDGNSELPFVCDVPGCSCGIPRHVFTRVAGALNGD